MLAPLTGNVPDEGGTIVDLPEPDEDEGNFTALFSIAQADLNTQQGKIRAVNCWSK